MGAENEPSGKSKKKDERSEVDTKAMADKDGRFLADESAQATPHYSIQ